MPTAPRKHVRSRAGLGLSTQAQHEAAEKGQISGKKAHITRPWAQCSHSEYTTPARRWWSPGASIHGAQAHRPGSPSADLKAAGNASRQHFRGRAARPICSIQHRELSTARPRTQLIGKPATRFAQPVGLDGAIEADQAEASALPPGRGSTWNKPGEFRGDVIPVPLGMVPECKQTSRSASGCVSGPRSAQGKRPSGTVAEAGCGKGRCSDAPQSPPMAMAMPSWEAAGNSGRHQRLRPIEHGSKRSTEVVGLDGSEGRSVAGSQAPIASCQMGETYGAISPTQVTSVKLLPIPEQVWSPNTRAPWPKRPGWR